MRRHFVNIILVIMCMMMSGLAEVSAQVERPKLVVGLVVDQMRWDYLYYYYDDYCQGGLRRIVDEGYSFENNLINYIPTVTAIGHASVYTGTTPAMHGICGNDFRIDGQKVYCCFDPAVRSVGSASKEGQMSPRLMLSTTIGDELKIATDFKARVFGVAFKDRAAILPAGHSADGAYWWDTSAGHFVTSTFYMDKLPQWVEEFNNTHQFTPEEYIGDKEVSVTNTFQMAEALIDNEQLGRDDITDLLTVSISSTDVIGHAFGTRGPENKSVYMRLDQDLKHFLDKLDREIGRDNYLLFLTADHGAAHNYNLMQSYRIPAGGWEGWKTVKTVNEYLRQACSVSSNLLLDVNSCRYYLDHDKIHAEGLKLDDVKQTLIDYLRKNPDFEYVVDFEKVSGYSMPQRLREMICNGYNPHRSGDVVVVMRPQVFIAKNSPDYKGTSHGAWNPYDSHIPFVLFGWKVKHGSTMTETHITDIAPTICSMLHIQMPNACIGEAREMK
ncbi:MAG: alkaline phosphatase family protein [Prevotella sp.]|nr:alkaline phosphatase family protein [Prevotella sp.]